MCIRPTSLLIGNQDSSFDDVDMESSLKKDKVLVEAIQVRKTSLGLGVDGLGCLGPNLYY